MGLRGGGDGETDDGEVFQKERELVLGARAKDERNDMPRSERSLGYCTEGGGEGWRRSIEAVLSTREWGILGVIKASSTK